MDRKTRRKQIDQAIKTIVVPFLRQQSFRGSLPHFRRYRANRVNLLTFQHSMDRPAFVVELANCPSSGIKDVYGNQLPASKVTAHHMFHRFRLGSDVFGGDYWFNYGGSLRFVDVFQQQADAVVALWESAERWWAADPFGQRV